MAVLSKLRELSLPYNCYEVGHTWEPECNAAALAVGVYCLIEGMKLYAPLYLLSQVFQRKFSFKDFVNTIQSIGTSSCFLGINGFAFIFIFCLFRKCMGKFYYLHCSYFPAFMASFLAILVERKNRRGPLALYVTNVASETMFRMAAARGIVKPLPNGEIYLFSTTMAFLLYFIRRNGFSKDFISAAFRFVLGKEEAKPKNKVIESPVSTNIVRAAIPPALFPVNAVEPNVEAILNNAQSSFFKKFCFSTKHASCPHDSSCLLYVLQGFVRPFLIGYAAFSGIQCISKGRKILLNPSLLLHLLTVQKTLNLGLFLGGFGGTYRLAKYGPCVIKLDTADQPAIYKSYRGVPNCFKFKFINCLLRWACNKDSPLYALPAAFLGGLFMKFFPSSTLSLYFFWKLIENGYVIGMHEGVLPQIRGSMLMLYATSTAFLFYAAVLEPHNLKPAYLKFLTRLTHNKIGEINRHVLDIFGTHASRLYSNFWPELDLRYTSRVFQESVLLWLIH